MPTLFSFLSTPLVFELIINFTEALAQVNHGVVLAGEQRVDADAGLHRELFETAALELMRNEHFSLLLGKLIQSSVQFFEQHTARISCFRSCIRRRQQVRG